MRNLVINYVKNMKKSDLISFINKNGYKATNEEIDIIFNYIKKYPEEILNNPVGYIKKLKGKISDDNYYEMLNLFNQYKNYL